MTIARTMCASLLLGSLACSLNDNPSSVEPGGGGAPPTQAPDPSSAPVTPPFGDSLTPPSMGEVPVATPPEPEPVEPATPPSDAGKPPAEEPPAEPLGACCSPHVGGGCADEGMTAYVCEADPRC